VPDGARQTSETGGIGLYYVEEWKRQSERIAPSGLIEGFSDAGGLEGPGLKRLARKLQRNDSNNRTKELLPTLSLDLPCNPQLQLRIGVAPKPITGVAVPQSRTSIKT